MPATDAKLNQLRLAGYKQGKEYDVVSKKIALEKNKRGGLVKKKKKKKKK